MVPSMGGVAVSLLFDGEVHVRYFLFPTQVGKVPGCLACARGAFVWSVEPAGKTIPPVVVSFHGVRWVIAWALCRRVVTSSASTSIVAIVAVVASVWLWMVGLISRDGGWCRRKLDSRWHGVDRSGLCVIDELAEGGDFGEESLEG